jgi:hypothetical protein
MEVVLRELLVGAGASPILVEILSGGVHRDFALPTGLPAQFAVAPSRVDHESLAVLDALGNKRDTSCRGWHSGFKRTGNLAQQFRGEGLTVERGNGLCLRA